MIKIPDFGGDKAKVLKWLADNKGLLIQQKKSTVKHADAIGSFNIFYPQGNGQSAKASPDSLTLSGSPSILVKAAINTTRLFDSHSDVHIDGLWNKSIKETKTNYLVKQHDFSFDGIITDEVKVSAVMMNWSDLGYPQYSGETQVLLYESTIEAANDTTGMFDKYARNKVREHSVGMRYVSLALAIDSKRYPDEQKVWNKYFDLVVNKDDVNAYGYFWAVTEAKNIEGSAVVKGSNFATPTISVEESPLDQPSPDTGKTKPEKSTFDAGAFLNNYQPKKYI